MESLLKRAFLVYINFIPNREPKMTNTLFNNQTPAAMVVACEKMAIAVVGDDMEAWARHHARADKFRNLKGFDWAEYDRLAKIHGVD